MQTPFPGMDPYLEDPYVWHGFHTHLVVEICKDLQPQIVPYYVADSEERVLLGPLERAILPDVNVREHGLEPEGGLAVAVREPGVEVAVPQEIQVPDLMLPIRLRDPLPNIAIP